MEINYTLLLLKMHYFFSMGSIGPVTPFVPVHGKQLGISSFIIGSVEATLPILFLIVKPIFGFFMDYFHAWRKVIFLTLFITTNIFYTMIFFLPGSVLPKHHFQNVSCGTLPHCDIEYHALAIRSYNSTKDITCHWICESTNFSMPLSFRANGNKAIISPDSMCLLNINDTLLCQENITDSYNCNVNCDNFKNDAYSSPALWSFILLMCFGETGIFISFSITDAFCFIILGQNKQLKFGKQRLWGAIGFGVAAFLAGYMMDLWSQEEVTIYTPSLLLVFVFTCIELICCIKLELPVELESTIILKDVFALLKSKSIIMFLCFITFAGMLNGILRNFLFWHVEDLAIATGYMGKIKLIEGLIVAGQTFGGEVIFFFSSGKILKKLGYDYTFVFCFICYALRLGIISLAPTPWWILVTELFLHGSSFALCITTAVAYGNTVAPPGASATVQGLIHGVINGLGLSIGSFVGGILYKNVGGTMALRIFSIFAAFSALTYFIFHISFFKRKADTRSNIKWRQPDDAKKHCTIADTR